MDPLAITERLRTQSAVFPCFNGMSHHGFGVPRLYKPCNRCGQFTICRSFSEGETVGFSTSMWVYPRVTHIFSFYPNLPPLKKWTSIPERWSNTLISMGNGHFFGVTTKFINQASSCYTFPCWKHHISKFSHIFQCFPIIFHIQLAIFVS